jgi:hypothetical protein
MSKLQDLANLVTVRNHIVKLISDRNSTTREETRLLDSIRAELDRLFVKETKVADFETLVSKPKGKETDASIYAQMQKEEVVEDDDGEEDEEADRAFAEQIAMTTKEEAEEAVKKLNDQKGDDKGIKEDPEVAKRLAEAKAQLNNKSTYKFKPAKHVENDDSETPSEAG